MQPARRSPLPSTNSHSPLITGDIRSSRIRNFRHKFVAPPATLAPHLAPDPCRLTPVTAHSPNRASSEDWAHRGYHPAGGPRRGKGHESAMQPTRCMSLRGGRQADKAISPSICSPLLSRPSLIRPLRSAFVPPPPASLGGAGRADSIRHVHKLVERLVF